MFRGPLKSKEHHDKWMSLETAQEVIQTSEVTSPMLLCLIFSGRLLKGIHKVDAEIKHNL